MKAFEYLRHFNLFAELQDNYLEEISKIVLERNYKKNMIVFMEGEPGEAVFFIKTGKVKVYRTYEDGKEHIINIFGAGEVFGEVTLFNNLPYPASALVYEDAVLCMIRNDDMENLVVHNPELALNLIRALNKKLIITQQKIQNLAFNDAFARTAFELIKLSREHGKKVDNGTLIDLEISRQELADMVGTTRETVSRAISNFKREKSVSELSGKIIISNAEKLKKWM